MHERVLSVLSVGCVAVGLLVFANGASGAEPRARKRPAAERNTNHLATSAESLTVAPGFKVELLHSAERNEGSWICMAVDNKGRLIISPQSDAQPLLRVSLSREGQVSSIEPIPAPLHQAMGLLYAHDSLYVNGNGPNGTGLYRLMDTNHNDRFDTNEV